MTRTSDHRMTPRPLVEAAVAYLGGIDTDPCWHPGSYVEAPTRYDGSCREQDGLSQPWRGAVYLNPPYSDPMPWAARASAYEGGPWAMLIKHDHTTAWWRVATRGASHLVLLSRRVRFPLPSGEEDGTANFPASVILRPGAYSDRVCLDAWRPWGRVLALE